MLSLVSFSGEDRIAEHLEVDFIDDRHCTIICNSFDILQSEEVLSLIKETKNCLIHSVIRFMRDKIANDMYRVFGLEGVRVFWDSHGQIPEDYHAASNFHTEAVSADIEKTFYQKADVLICADEKTISHFKKKYGVRDMKYLVCPDDGFKEEISSLIL